MSTSHPHTPMTETSPNTRLAALSDAVFAIALTLLILDVRLPEGAAITSTPALWRALQGLGPSGFAFVLSFGIILITWVNHRHTLKLVGAASGAFIYANGFLLLTVVSLPFPTALLGTFLLSDHAAPAVVLYDGVLVGQALAWILLTGSALRGHLAVDDHAAAILRTNNRHAYGALAFYLLLAVAAFWVPIAIAAVTTVSWVFWLVRSMQIGAPG